jgi:hypothetical protein
MVHNPNNYPELLIDRIDIEARHLRAFRYAHPLEGTAYLMSDSGAIIASPVEETYTLTEKSLGTVHINVTGIKSGIYNGVVPFTMYRCHLTERWYQYTRKTAGVEDESIDRLTPEDLTRPGIMVVWQPDMSHTTMVDGNHRLCRRWRDGLTTFEFAMVLRPHIEHLVRPADSDEALLNVTDLVRRLTK